MEKAEIFALVKEMLEEHATLHDVSAIKPEACLQDDLGIDSLERVVVVMEIEKELCIQLYDGHVYDKITVQNLVDGIYAEINK